MTTYAVVGRPVTRQEGPDKVSGTFLYAADVALPGMLWGKVLRSPFPHARIVHIDTTRALSLAGVRAVITGKDTAAGKSWEAWMQRYREKKAAGEKNIGLHPEALD